MKSNGATNLVHAMTLHDYKQLDLKRPLTDRPMRGARAGGAVPDTPSKGKTTRYGEIG